MPISSEPCHLAHPSTPPSLQDHCGDANKVAKPPPPLLRLDLSVSESRLVDDALEVVLRVRTQWPRDAVASKVFTDGITNKIVGFWRRDDAAKRDVFLVRVYGKKTESWIDREAEQRNMRLMASIGCAKPLHAVFTNGICYGFVEGEVLTIETVKDPLVNRLVAKEMVRIHALKPEKGLGPTLWPTLRKLLSLLPASLDDPAEEARLRASVPSTTQLSLEAEKLERLVGEKGNSPLVFCHNDLLVGNIVWNKEENRTYFIDFEYGGFNYLAYDIADHFAEHTGVDAKLDHRLYPDKSYQTRWLRDYLRFSKAREKGVDDDDAAVDGIHVTEEEVEALYTQVQMFAAVSDFLWAVWSILQAKHSSIDFDFVQYALSKYSGYVEKMEKVVQN